MTSTEFSFEALEAPAWLAEINEPVRLSELEAGAPTQQLAALPARAKDESMLKLDQLVDREPERVAAQVRSWMGED
jgi:flagellar M-ring protein FliF